MKFLRSSPYTGAASVFLCAALAGVIVLLLLIAPLLRTRIYDALTSARQETGAMLYNLSIANVLRYGVIESVDAAQRTLTATFDNHVGQTQRLRLRVPRNAYIAFEELQGDGQVLDSLSERTPASLADIRPGDRIAFLLARDVSGKLIVNYLLFGNPL